MPEKKTTKVVTGKCRLSYCHIWEPSSAVDGGEKKYSACIVIPKSDKVTVKKIRDAIEAAIQLGKQTKWGGKEPKNLKTPLRDGDEEREDDKVFANAWFLNANSNRKPGVVDMDLNDILDTDEVYSGCYCRFSLNFFPFSSHGNNGVGVGLNSVQKVRDGQRLDSDSDPKKDFNDDFQDDEDDLDDIM